MTPEIFKNLEFFVLLPLVLVAINLARLMGGQAFRSAMLTASVLFIGALPGLTWSYAALLLSLAVFGFAYARSTIGSGTAGRSGPFFAAAGIVLLVFVAVKYGFWAFTPGLANLRTTLTSSLLPLFGFAFLGLKLYSVIADVHAGKLKSLPVLDYLLYLFWFPAFMSGPLDRIAPFQGSLERAAAAPVPGLQDYLDHLPRFIMGCFKVFVVAGIFHEFALPSLENRDLMVFSAVYLGAVCYYFYEYMNFSGYSDLSISTSRMVGVPLPENFNHPYLATSLTDLWRRWHMSFAGWLRDYVYYPLLFWLRQKTEASSKGAQTGLAALSIFVTFAVCGVWHGETWGMLFFGLSSGFVLAVETVIAAYYSKRVSSALADKPALEFGYRVLAMLVTFHIAIITFAPVLLSNAQFAIVAARAGLWLKQLVSALSGIVT